jgi:hypothetical protein
MLWGTALFAVLMIVMGRWGWRAAATLVSPVLGPDERAKQERVYRRGAVTLLILGLALLGFAIVGLANGMLHS